MMQDTTSIGALEQKNTDRSLNLERGRLRVHPYLAPVVIVLLQLLYLVPDIFYRPLNLNDEGIAAYWAYAILKGYKPYVDASMPGYGPGQSFVLARLFGLFGPFILVERIWDLAVRLAIGIVVYLIAKKLTLPSVALAVWLFTTLILLLPRSFYYGYAVFPALLFGLISVLFLIQAIQQQREQPYWLLASGLAVGIEALFRYDLGFYVLASNLAVLSLFCLSRPTATGTKLTHKLLLIAKSSKWFVLGTLAVVLPVASYFLTTVPLDTLWHEFFTIPVLIRNAMTVPHPPLVPSSIFEIGEWLTFYWSAAVCVLASVQVIRGYRGTSGITNIKIWGMVSLIPLILMSFIQTLSRNDVLHAIPSQVPALILVAALTPQTLEFMRGRTLRIARIAGYALVSIAALFFLADAWQRDVLFMTDGGGNSCSSRLQVSGPICVSPDQAKAVDYVRARTSPDERIYVANSRNDRVLVSDNMLYFLAERLSATNYHWVAPYYTTTYPVQKKIIEDIKRAHVRYVVVWSGSEDIVEPANGSAVSSGVTLLDDFIRSDYQQVAHFGDYGIWLVR
jgi:hypothetical protein